MHFLIEQEFQDLYFADYYTILVVVDEPDSSSIRRVHHQPNRTEVVADNGVSHTTLDHVIRHMAFACVDEKGDNIPSAVQLSFNHRH